MGISISGKIFNGKNISIKNNKILINGKIVDVDDKQINIIIDGDLQSLEVDSCDTIEIKGSVGTLRNGSGDITCGDVKGDVTSGSGNIKPKQVIGNVKTGSGDVKCEGNISGNVQTGSGDISYKKIDSPMKN